MILSPIERQLLLALRKGKHFESNPVTPIELISLEPEAANPAGRNLVKLGLAARVHDSERPAALLLHITDAGISEADILNHAEKKLTFKERLKTLPIGKAFWDVVKIGLGAVIGVMAAKFFGK